MIQLPAGTPGGAFTCTPAKPTGEADSPRRKQMKCKIKCISDPAHDSGIGVPARLGLVLLRLALLLGQQAGVDVGKHASMRDRHAAVRNADVWSSTLRIRWRHITESQETHSKEMKRKEISLAQQLGQLVVVADRQQDVARTDPAFLVVPGGVARQLQHLRCSPFKSDITIAHWSVRSDDAQATAAHTAFLDSGTGQRMHTHIR